MSSWGSSTATVFEANLPGSHGGFKTQVRGVRRGLQNTRNVGAPEFGARQIVFEEVPGSSVCRALLVPYSSKPNVRRTRSGSKPAFFAASMTVARSFSMDIG